ncbi:MAG: hypothetical protein AB7N71_13590 [Phycisphaerae bacterium]
MRQNRELYGGRNDLEVIVDPQQRMDPAFDHRFYDTTTEWLVEQGFRAVGASINHTMSQALPFAETYIQFFVHDEMRIVASCFVVADLYNPATRSPAPYGCVEFSTMFDDDTFVSTSPMNAASHTNDYPGVVRFFESDRANLHELLAAHQRHVAEFRAQHPDRIAREFRNIDDVIEAEHRQHDWIVAYRKAHGWITTEELRRMSPKNTPAFMIGLIMWNVRRMS